MTNGLVGVLVQNVDLLFCLQEFRSILYGTKGNIKRRKGRIKLSTDKGGDRIVGFTQVISVTFSQISWILDYEVCQKIVLQNKAKYTTCTCSATINSTRMTSGYNK